MITQLELGSAGAVAGLQENDVITVIDGVAVTVIDDGFIVPRSTVTAAIDPTASVLRVTVFRPYVREEHNVSPSAQRL